MADLNLGYLISKFVNYQALNTQKQPSAKAPAQTSLQHQPLLHRKLPQ